MWVWVDGDKSGGSAQKRHRVPPGVVLAGGNHSSPAAVGTAVSCLFLFPLSRMLISTCVKVPIVHMRWRFVASFTGKFHEVLPAGELSQKKITVSVVTSSH